MPRSRCRRCPSPSGGRERAPSCGCSARVARLATPFLESRSFSLALYALLNLGRSRRAARRCGLLRGRRRAPRPLAVQASVGQRTRSARVSASPPWQARSASVASSRAAVAGWPRAAAIVPPGAAGWLPVRGPGRRARPSRPTWPASRRCCLPDRWRSPRTCAVPRRGRSTRSAKRIRQSPESRRHAKPEPASLEENSNVAEVEPDDDAGPESIDVSGSVVSPGSATTTVHDHVAGVWSVLPAGSVARTSKVCGPAESPERVAGDVQPAQSPSSRRHSKLEPASLEENSNLADVRVRRRRWAGGDRRLGRRVSAGGVGAAGGVEARGSFRRMNFATDGTPWSFSTNSM